MFLPELARRQEVVGPLFDLANANIEPGGDDSNLVQATGQVDDNLATTVIINNLEFTNVTVLHHDFEEADDNL